MHNFPKNRNFQLLASIAYTGVSGLEELASAAERRKQQKLMLAEYQQLHGLSDLEMENKGISAEDLGELGDPSLKSPLKRRLVTPLRDAVYHVSSCCTGKQELWGAEERRMFRRQLGLVADYCGVQVLNFTILADHFHLLVRVPIQASRMNLMPEEVLRRIEVLHADLGLASKLAEALMEADLTKEGTALQHFSALQLQRGVRASLPNESARDWALREMERHRGLMADLTSFLGILKQRYTRWFNGTHDRFGTLWAGRFRSLLVQDTAEAVQAVSAYLDLNAVRLGLVEDPTEYEFCAAGEARRSSGMAREGIQAVVQHGEMDAGTAAWSELAEQHRSLLWGNVQTASGVRDGTAGAPGKPRRYRDLPLRTVRPLVMADLFSERQSVFHEVAALGSERFMESLLRSNRGVFGADGTSRGDWLLLRSGVVGYWIVRGLRVLKNTRLLC
jgi:putative transposase